MEFYHLLIQALEIYSNHQYCFQTTKNIVVYF